MIFLTVMVSTSLLFWYCYFGKIATDSFEAMSDCLYESDWPSLPIELQKYFIIMIANAQRKVHYHGFGIVKLDLEAFTKVWINFKWIFLLFITLFSFCSFSKPFSHITWCLRLSLNEHFKDNVECSERCPFMFAEWMIDYSIFQFVHSQSILVYSEFHW